VKIVRLWEEESLKPSWKKKLLKRKLIPQICKSHLSRIKRPHLSIFVFCTFSFGMNFLHPKSLFCEANKLNLRDVKSLLGLWTPCAM
jgi:hypothetical protein